MNFASAVRSFRSSQARGALLVLALSLMLPGVAPLAAAPDAAVLMTLQKLTRHDFPSLDKEGWRASAGVVRPPSLDPPGPAGHPPLAGGESRPGDFVEDHQDSERAVLEARVREVRELLTTLDGLQTHLAGLAETALNHADAAPTLDERRRYERLYTETSARLGELQATRAEIERQLGVLETQLETAVGDR